METVTTLMLSNNIHVHNALDDIYVYLNFRYLPAFSHCHSTVYLIYYF